MTENNRADVLLGLQWGDEGKGKIVDVLTPHYKMVARFQGGPNAGHSLAFEGKKYILHTIPSGIFHPGCLNVVGNGVVVDPYIFSNEMDQLNIPLDKLKDSLFICSKAHLILPSHRLLDAAFELKKGKLKIGSTLKGIGPAYTDKVARSGIRIADASAADFTEKYDLLKAEHLSMATSLGCIVEDLRLDGLTFDAYEQAWFKGLERLLAVPQVQSELFVNEALDKGYRVLAEGAQGTLLDIDFGSYPFVTSSNTIAAGACIGLGLAPSRIGEVFGVFKAYCTRVGSGPFPTELHGDDGDHIRKMGNEYGSTTGRPRRCGWLDLPALKYAVMINGVSRLIMTKADVLNELERIKVCVAYEVDGEQKNILPPAGNLVNATPVYKELKGWKSDLDDVDAFEKLPPALLEFVSLIEEYIGITVDIISLGPDRKQTLFRKGAGILERLSKKF